MKNNSPILISILVLIASIVSIVSVYWTVKNTNMENVVDDDDSDSEDELDATEYVCSVFYPTKTSYLQREEDDDIIEGYKKNIRPKKKLVVPKKIKRKPPMNQDLQKYRRNLRMSTQTPVGGGSSPLPIVPKGENGQLPPPPMGTSSPPPRGLPVPYLPPPPMGTSSPPPDRFPTPSMMTTTPPPRKPSFLQPPITGCEADIVNKRMQCPTNTTISNGNIRYGRWNNTICSHSTVATETPTSTATPAIFKDYPLPPAALNKNSYQFTQPLNQLLQDDPYRNVFKHYEVTYNCS